MNKFDAINQAVREAKANEDPHKHHAGSYGTTAYWMRLANNETYRAHNGQYSDHYSRRA